MEASTADISDEDERQAAQEMRAKKVGEAASNWRISHGRIYIDKQTATVLEAA